MVHFGLSVLEARLSEILQNQSVHPLLNALKNLIKNFEGEIQHDWQRFLEISLQLKESSPPTVITHGDAPGNILVTSPEEIFIIDWDDIVLAPPERDLWFLHDNPDFIEGYQEIYPEYQPLELARQFYVYSRYFADMVEYFDEILGDYSEAHMQNNFNALKQSCFDKWLRPIIRSFDSM